MKDKLTELIRTKLIDFKQMGYPPKAFEPFVDSLKSEVLELIAKELPKEKESPNGEDCVCMAHDESECCGCGADWSDNRPYNQCLKAIKHKLGVE